MTARPKCPSMLSKSWLSKTLMILGTVTVLPDYVCFFISIRTRTLVDMYSC